MNRPDLICSSPTRTRFRQFRGAFAWKYLKNSNYSRRAGISWKRKTFFSFAPRRDQVSQCGMIAIKLYDDDDDDVAALSLTHSLDSALLWYAIAQFEYLSLGWFLLAGAHPYAYDVGRFDIWFGLLIFRRLKKLPCTMLMLFLNETRKEVYWAVEGANIIDEFEPKRYG